ncbi:MFS transporter [Herbaspirillum sp. NPDC101396]|uniref:MFS transporter n=1 Tax=Herbaspirillum sp. NPDC101396 TaxID=3364005 RepID=UPI00383BD7EE
MAQNDGGADACRFEEAGPERASAVMPRAMVLLFAMACGVSVANVYYAQPLLDALAAEFGFSQAAVGLVVTATQLGSALALVLVVPLGDLLDRRRLTLAQLLLLFAALVGVGLASSPAWLLVGMLAVGMLGTAMTQGLISYAAALAAPQERGRVVGTAQAGVVIGLLLARTLAGLIADVAGWRMVYAVSAVLALLMLALLHGRLPQRPADAGVTRLSYGQLLASMATLMLHDRVLQIRGVIAMLMFAVLNIFWSALVLPLSAPPYSLSHAAIGAFGLIGVVGTLGAAKAGSWADRGRGQWTSGVALALLAAAWLPLSLLSWSLWALAAGVLLLDLAAQAIHVTNQSMIFRANATAHSRLVACYMIFYAVGSGAGAVLSTSAFAAWGWGGVCALGAAVSVLGLMFWSWSLRYMPHP